MPIKTNAPLTGLQMSGRAMVVNKDEPLDPEDRCISIAREFSDSPGGELIKHGPHSAEQCWLELVKPLIEKTKGKIRIDLDGAYGYAGSFIGWLFTSIVRTMGAYDTLSRLQICYSESTDRLSDAVGTILDQIYADKAHQKLRGEPMTNWEPVPADHPVWEIGRSPEKITESWSQRRDWDKGGVVRDLLLSLPVDLTQWFCLDVAEFYFQVNGVPHWDLGHPRKYALGQIDAQTLARHWNYESQYNRQNLTASVEMPFHTNALLSMLHDTRYELTTLISMFRDYWQSAVRIPPDWIGGRLHYLLDIWNMAGYRGLEMDVPLDPADYGAEMVR